MNNMSNPVKCLLVIIGFILLTGGHLRATGISGDILIDKNLFDPERKKWEIEEKTMKKPINKNNTNKLLSEIVLFGTVLSDQYDYAVIRVKQNNKIKHQNRPYMVGDYVNGLILKDIGDNKIVLFDDVTQGNYEIYLNDGKKDRMPVKTPIPSKPSEKMSSAKKRPKPTPGVSGEFLKKRLTKSLEVLKGNKSPLVMKQAERDLMTLEKIITGMSEKEIGEVITFRQELDKMRP